MRSVFIAIILITGCARHSEKSSPADRKAQIEYLITDSTAALVALADPVTNWPSVTDCDGTEWAGLACAGGYPVKIELAEYSPGEIHRRPAPSCWNSTDGDMGSKSTISNDMLLGYILCAWERRDLGALQRLADYGERHHWVMGAPATAIGDVVIKPYVLGILGRAIYVLSNKADNRLYRNTPITFDDTALDYVRHLQSLAIVLAGEVTTTHEADLVDINDSMLKRLHELVDAEPLNPGFATALGIYTGDLDRAVDLFLDTATPIPSYVRGDNASAFAFAERLYWLKKAHSHMKD